MKDAFVNNQSNEVSITTEITPEVTPEELQNLVQFVSTLIRIDRRISKSECKKDDK